MRTRTATYAGGLTAPSPLPSDRALALEAATTAELETTFLRGTMPKLDDLVGWEFRGINAPAWAKLAGIKKFVKGFYLQGDVPVPSSPGKPGEFTPPRVARADPDRADPDRGARGGVVRGYNCPAVQDALDEPWQPLPSAHAPKRFGFYTVAPVDPTAKDNRYLNAVLLDYGQGGNKAWDPSRGLRDYLVQVDPDNRDLFLGKAYYALGPLRVASNFFILERMRPGLRELAER